MTQKIVVITKSGKINKWSKPTDTPELQKEPETPQKVARPALKNETNTPKESKRIEKVRLTQEDDEYTFKDNADKLI